MEAQPFVATARLTVKLLSLTDAPFILELVNTEGWLKFIGNRNITSDTEAQAYIQRILENPNITYWVVQRNEQQDLIGIVTYIKRDYLEHHDIGFAFLPNVAKNGYAYEATTAVLEKLVREHNLTYILATTIPENAPSIKLLQKLGLGFEKELEMGNLKLQVYGAAAVTLKLPQTTALQQLL